MSARIVEWYESHWFLDTETAIDMVCDKYNIAHHRAIEIYREYLRMNCGE